MNKSKLTAISRRKPSAPMKWLHKRELLKGRALDFGCGKGFDANYYHIDAYDPNFKPDYPTTQYDTITCNYVLNVLNNRLEMAMCLNEIFSLLKKTGKAYITVRRDIKQTIVTQKGTIQHPVYLNETSNKMFQIKSIYKTSGFEIYELSK